MVSRSCVLPGCDCCKARDQSPGAFSSLSACQWPHSTRPQVLFCSQSRGGRLILQRYTSNFDGFRGLNWPSQVEDLGSRGPCWVHAVRKFPTVCLGWGETMFTILFFYKASTSCLLCGSVCHGNPCRTPALKNFPILSWIICPHWADTFLHISP